MKKYLIIVVLAALSGCVTYVTPVAPPPPRTEVVGVAPYPGAVWAGGAWVWGAGQGYYWRPGYWHAGYWRGGWGWHGGWR